VTKESFQPQNKTNDLLADKDIFLSNFGASSIETKLANPLGSS
jgi:hypothetical protein